MACDRVRPQASDRVVRPRTAASGLAGRVAQAVLEAQMPEKSTHWPVRAFSRDRRAAFLVAILAVGWVGEASRSSLHAPISVERPMEEQAAPHLECGASREEPQMKSLSLAVAATSALALAGAASATNHVLKLARGGDAVVIPHHPSQNPGSAITIEYWIKWSGAPANPSNVKYGRPVSKRSPSAGAYSVTWFDLSYMDGEMHGVGQVSPTVTLSTDWEHHAFTWSAQSRQIRFYRNGELVRSESYNPQTLAATTDQLRFGNTAYGFENLTQFKGMLDDVRIWRVERTEAQLEETMCVSIGSAEASQYTGLIGSWTFEKGASDATGVNNGSLAGGAAIVEETVCLEPCPGDLDGSSAVDAVDLAIILTNWGMPSPKYPAADTNADGVVDGADLATVLSGWGACP